MRKILAYILIASVLWSCTEIDGSKIYDSHLCKLTVNVLWPEGYNSREGVAIAIENISSGAAYQASTLADGSAQIVLPEGMYRLTVSDRTGNDIFNGLVDKKILSEDSQVAINLKYSRAGTLVIKELYTGGCSKYPQEGTYQADKYVIIHNNDVIVQYLDSLCIGTLSPYNSNSTNPWIERDPSSGEVTYRSFVPLIQAVWQIRGNGHSFPLQSGEDAVIALSGAVNHKAQYQKSVNLDNADYFACYNPTYFPNTTYHPAPGPNILQDRILDVVIKTGQANAWSVSVSSPAFVIFKAVGTTIQDFVAVAENVIQVPGSTVDNVVAVPLGWVIDGVEVFDGRQSNNSKRLSPEVDAGFVTQSDTFQGFTMHRLVDEKASESNGYEVLMDTNNSSNDFYERKIQSLNE